MNPLFMSKNVVDSGNAKKVGQDQKHLKLDIVTQDKPISAIGFNFGSKIEKLYNGNEIDICYSINENEWNGKRQLQLLIKDIK